MGKHAFLSASSAHRWLMCPPSVKACEGVEEHTSPYALQGTDCHELCAYKVEKALGRPVSDPTEHLDYYDREMEDCAEAYCQFVMEQVAEAKRLCPDPQVLVEQRLDFSRWVEGGFGTGDCVIVADDVLQVIDYKHGVGILVSAEKNPQMMCYALGAIVLFDGLYDISRIRMTIFQPRKENVSTYELTKEELLAWADGVLAPAAKLAMKGEGEYKAGDHCVFCRIKATCRKRAEYNLEMARYDFKVPGNLTAMEISAILPRIDSLTAWASDVREYALRQALLGKKFPGYKVVEGRSVRKYLDEASVAKAVIDAGKDPYEKRLLGVTAMTTLLGGKKHFDEVLGKLTVRSSGKPVLVQETDKRREISTAEEDFAR